MVFLKRQSFSAGFERESEFRGVVRSTGIETVLRVRKTQITGGINSDAAGYYLRVTGRRGERQSLWLLVPDSVWHVFSL